MNLLDRIKAVRQGGEVKRAHTFPIFGEYLNSTHQWNVMMLCHLLFPDARKELLIACAIHDVGEHWAFGDTPAHAKWLDPGMGRRVELMEFAQLNKLGIKPELTPEERDILSALDKLELYIWSLDQVNNYGNQRCQIVLQRLNGYFSDTKTKVPPEIYDLWQQWTYVPLNELPKETTDEQR